MSLKLVLKSLLPPILLTYLQRKIFKSLICFTGPYENWEQAQNDSFGYDDNYILEKVTNAILKVKNGEAVYERDAITFNKIQYSWPVAATLMWAAVENKGCLSILDFGGSLGSSYFQNRQLLDSLKTVRWSIIEQQKFVRRGKELLENNQLIFYEEIEECIQKENPNIVLFSSVLQYLKNPSETIKRAISHSPSFVVIDLTIVNSSSRNQIYVQKNPKNICHSSYSVQSLAESEILSVLIKENYQLIDTFYSSIDFPSLQFINSEFKGFIFKKV